MFYIVEGPDGAGKTTLVNQLVAAHPGAKVLHFGKPTTDEEAFNYWQVYLRAIKENANTPVAIFDRSWYTDIVYGPIIRNRIEMTHTNMEILELAVKACGGGVILYLTANTTLLWKRCKQRGETYITCMDQLNRLRADYELVMKQPIYLPVVRIDTSVRW